MESIDLPIARDDRNSTDWVLCDDCIKKAKTGPISFIEQKAASCARLENLANAKEGKKERPESSSKAMQKLKSSFLNGTKNIRRETASLWNTMGTWTNSILKHDNGDEDKYFGIVEKKGHLAQKMKTLLKIGDDEKNIVKEEADAGSQDKELHAGDN